MGDSPMNRRESMYSRSMISGKGPSNRVSFKSAAGREEVLRDMRAYKKQGGTIAELEKIVEALREGLP